LIVSCAPGVMGTTVRQFGHPILTPPCNPSARLCDMAATSRRKTLWVWVVVVTLFVGAVWVAVSTIHSSFQPLSVIKEPFPDEANRPEASEHDRGAVNFLVFGQVESDNKTLSIFHLAQGRRRVEVLRSEEHTSELQSRFDL